MIMTFLFFSVCFVVLCVGFLFFLRRDRKNARS